MNFNLSTEQMMVRDLCRNLAKNEIIPIAEELDKTGQFPYEVWKKMAGLGIAVFPFLKSAGDWNWIGFP